MPHRKAKSAARSIGYSVPINASEEDKVRCEVVSLDLVYGSDLDMTRSVDDSDVTM